MGKVSSFLLISLIVAAVSSFPLEDDKPKSNGPYDLLSHPQTRVNEDKPQVVPSSINGSERDESEQSQQSQPKTDAPPQTEIQEPTPKPVHHYRDGPIIQRRSADSSSDESNSSDDQSRSSDEKKIQKPTPKPVHHYRDGPIIQRRSADSSSDDQSSTSDEKQHHQSPLLLQRKNVDSSSDVISSTDKNVNSEEQQISKTKNHQRRDTDDENDKKDNQSNIQSDSPPLLGRSPVYLPESKNTARTPSSLVPDLIPTSTSHLQTSIQEDNLHERKTRDLADKSTQSSTTPRDETGTRKSDSSTNDQDEKDEYKNNPVVLHSYPPVLTSTQNRKVRDVGENQPHLLASNPQSSLSDEVSRSKAAVPSSTTTEKTKISSTVTQ